MSRRKLPELKTSHSNLMDHIADFVCQTTNISNRHTTEKVGTAYNGIIQFFLRFWAQIFQTKSVTKDEEDNISRLETVDGYLPLLTADELQALKLFLADYQKQLKIAQNGVPKELGSHGESGSTGRPMEQGSSHCEPVAEREADYQKQFDIAKNKTLN